MELKIRSGALKADVWLEEFIRNTVLYAVWHHREPVESVRVNLRRAAADEIICDLHATRGDGELVAVTGSSCECFEAVQIAADRLEVALWGAPGQTKRWHGQSRQAA